MSTRSVDILTFYYIGRSERHLLAAIEKNQFRTPIHLEDSFLTSRSWSSFSITLTLALLSKSKIWPLELSSILLFRRNFPPNLSAVALPLLLPEHRALVSFCKLNKGEYHNVFIKFPNFDDAVTR